MLGLVRCGAPNLGARRFAMLAGVGLLLGACSAEDRIQPARSAASAPSTAKPEALSLNPDRFAAFARARRVDTNSEVTRVSAEKSFAQREALVAEMLAGQTLDMASLEADVAEFRSELIVRKYFASFLEDKLSEPQLRAYFAAHGAEFLPYRARVAKIEINGASDEKSYQRILNVEKQLAAGASFAEIAIKYSDDRSTASRGGDAGWLESKQLPTQIEVALRTMRVEEVSPPIATKSGVVLVKLLSSLELHSVPFESAADEVRARVRYAEQTKETARLLAAAGHSKVADDAQMISQATGSQE